MIENYILWLVGEPTEENELTPYERGVRSGTWTEDRLDKFIWGRPYHGICSAEECLKRQEETFQRWYTEAWKSGDEDWQQYWIGWITTARESLQLLKEQGN